MKNSFFETKTFTLFWTLNKTISLAFGKVQKKGFQNCFWPIREIVRRNRLLWTFLRLLFIFGLWAKISLIFSKNFSAQFWKLLSTHSDGQLDEIQLFWKLHFFELSVKLFLTLAKMLVQSFQNSSVRVHTNTLMKNNFFEKIFFNFFRTLNETFSDLGQGFIERFSKLFSTCSENNSKN